AKYQLASDNNLVSWTAFLNILGTQIFNNGLQSDDSGLRNRRYVMYGNGTLLLQQMGRKDEGDYTCHATNKLGKDERKLSVKLASNAPQIGLNSQSLVKVKLGEAVKLSCQATGEPKPRITWISPHTDVIPPLSDKYRVVDDGTLILKKVTLADEGKYACVARNSAGDDIKNMIVEAELQEPYINSVRGKTSAKLLCPARGTPIPEISWVLPNGTMLSPGRRLQRITHHFGNGTLWISQPTPSDKGIYRCLARNIAGQAEKRYSLEAGWKPVIRGTTGRLSPLCWSMLCICSRN
uniref:Ig-like domain-containing protein n=1 Tax=Xiphophorus couchianus TaxID=32473 RepID=A0A3B5M2Z3_9TELE